MAEEPVGGRPGEQSASVVARRSHASGPTRREAGGCYGTCPRARSRRPCRAGAFGSRAPDQGPRKRPGRKGLGRSRHGRRVDRVPSRPGSVPTTAPGSWPGPGPIPASGSDCSPTVRVPSGRWTCWAHRGSISSSWRTRRQCITSWSAPCVPATPGPCSGCRRAGTSRRLPLARGLDPRGVLREFGVELGPGVEVRVWDSTSEVRYLVLPERPPGTERLGEDELAGLVTRDAMIGVARELRPSGERP